MAVASITLNIVDGKGDTSTVTLYTTDSLPLVNTIAGIGDLITLVRAVIGGGISSASLCFQIAIPVLDSVVQDASLDIEEGALFLQRVESGHERRNRIPTFREDMFVADTREVDLANVAVAAFVAALKGGITTAGGDLVFTDDRGSDIVSIYDAYEAFQSSRSRK